MLDTCTPIDLGPNSCEIWASTVPDLGFVVVDKLLLDLISFKMVSNSLFCHCFFVLKSVSKLVFRCWFDWVQLVDFLSYHHLNLPEFLHLSYPQGKVSLIT